MRVRLNGSTTFHYDSSVPVEPLRKKGNVFVIVDPGKTNMAVIVGNPFGNVYSVLELSGSDDFERQYHGGRVMDTSDYCKEFRDFLRNYLAEVDVVEFGIEEAITYKDEKYHRSVMTLTEIRADLISMCQDAYGYKPMEINNQVWKSHVIPKGYNHRGQKASWEYLKDKGFAQYTHDVTDVLCMYLYIVYQKKDKYPIWCDNTEKAFDAFDYYIYPLGTEPKGMQPFAYNPQFSIEDNMAFYLNRSIRNGVTTIDIDKLSLENIYKHAFGFTQNYESNQATLLVVRK